MIHSRHLPRLTLTRAARLLNAGLVTSEELSLYCHALAVAGEEKWHLNAFTRIIPQDTLMEQAQQSDSRRRASPHDVSPLEGIPISIKANLAVETEALTAASRILGSVSATCTPDTTPPPVGYNASVVDILQQSGTVLVGITNMDEFGMGSLGTNVAESANTKSTVTRNPIPFLSRLQLQNSTHIKDSDEHMAEIIRTPFEELMYCHTDPTDELLLSAGGSSCGSAVSIAHGSSLASLGTDTGGSVRLPAAWCGVVGLKPSYGLLSRHGVVSYASSLDTVGILVPSVDCATTMLNSLAQRRPNHPVSRDSTASFYDSTTSLSHVIENRSNSSPKSGVNKTSELLSGVKIGIPAAFSVTECPPAIQEAWARGAEMLQRHGATIKIIPVETISPEIIKNSLAAYYVLASAEACSNLSRYDGLRYGVSANLDMASNGPSDAKDENIDLDMTLLERQYSATRTQGFGKEVTRRIMCGTSVLSSDRFHTHYEAAAKLRAVLTQQLNAALDEVNLLLIPTALSGPCSLDEIPGSTEMFANDVMTVPISLAGLPAVSVPITLQEKDGKDIANMASLQIVGARLGEELMLKAATIIDQATETK